jgi:type III secretory pathway component EscS
MNQASKRYAREFIVAMVAYVIVIIVSRLTLNNIGESSWRFLIALLPVIPVIFLIVGFMRYLSEIDELQQRIQLQAIGFAAGTTGLLTFAYGFLELVGFPRFSTFFLFPMMIMFWGIGLSYFSRRYQ